MHGRHLTKLLGLSLLVAVGIMAVSASAAQAKWLLLLNGTSVNELTLNVQVLPGKLSVPAIELEIECSGGTAVAAVKTIESGADLEGSGTATFTGCVVVGGETFCEVHSTGKANGTIVAEGKGKKATHSAGGETVEGKLESTNFTTIEIDGELCAAAENDGVVNGGAHLQVLEALKDTKIKLVHLDDLTLKYGTHASTLSSSEGGAVLGHATDLNANATWAIHLVP